MGLEKIKQKTHHAPYTTVSESYIEGTVVPKTSDYGTALEGPGANGEPMQITMVRKIGDQTKPAEYREEVETFTLAGPSMELVDPAQQVAAQQTPILELPEEPPITGKRKGKKSADALEAMILKQNAIIANMMQMQAKPPAPITPTIPNIPDPQKIKVTFNTLQGSIAIMYLAAIDSPACLTLVQRPDAETQYSPPISMDNPLNVTVGATTHEVFSIGLSFTFDNKNFTVLVK